MSAHDFVVWCIVCGADYFDKANVLAGYGCSTIRPWIVECRRVTTDIVESTVSASGTLPPSGGKQFYEKLSLFKTFIAFCRTAAERKTRPPTEEQQRVACKEFMFLYRYWCIRWNDFPRATGSVTDEHPLFAGAAAAAAVDPAAPAASTT